MSRLDEDLVMKQEYELWEAAKMSNPTVFERHLGPYVNVVCNYYRCSGREYVMTLPSYHLQCYNIEQYETVSVSENRIQNYYLVNSRIAASEEIMTCHVTSTWKKMTNGWKIVFHMRALIN